jgi:hypothetical protein
MDQADPKLLDGVAADKDSMWNLMAHILILNLGYFQIRRHDINMREGAIFSGTMPVFLSRGNEYDIPRSNGYFFVIRGNYTFAFRDNEYLFGRVAMKFVPYTLAEVPCCIKKFSLRSFPIIACKVTGPVNILSSHGSLATWSTLINFIIIAFFIELLLLLLFMRLSRQVREYAR